MAIYLREDGTSVKIDDDSVIVEAPNGTKLLFATIEEAEAMIASLDKNPEFERIV
jgi:hypothetical protein